MNGGLTCYDECKSSPNYAQVPEIPEGHLIEKHARVDEAAQLVISKSCNPDVQYGFKVSNSRWVSFQQDCIVEKEKGDEKHSLESLPVYRNTKARIRISSPVVFVSTSEP